jgi:hypothetical protein
MIDMKLTDGEKKNREKSVTMLLGLSFLIVGLYHMPW